MEYKYEIVELTQDEWQKYKEIRLLALKSDPQAFGSNYKREDAFTEEKWRERLMEYSNNSKRWYSFIKSNESEKILGTMNAYSSEDGVAMIFGVYVHPAHRAKGLSSQLMKNLISKILSDKSIKLIKLTVNKEQAAAVGLYKKFGFEVVGEEAIVMGDGASHIEYNMQKSLQ